ncbi:AAA family ATPase [Micromonospora sp. NPDC048930]|uniref:AAA family ATPase n=1 Tax=Micromonospora sp. NPDC048930 TaxID=3364261 RepID=UPI00371C04FE
MTRSESLVELIANRLAADRVPDDAGDLVLAALTGEADLDAALAGEPPLLAPPDTSSDEPTEPVWLSSVTVAGFRGVGPERTLAVEPGPGLTVVVGRNGSGKSSFAEAIELALTGDSARRADRDTGWRNLHAGDPCRIAVELRVDGMATPTRVVRSWPSDTAPGAAEVTVTSAHGSHPDLAELGLARPLALYRPFLTAELGRPAAGTPRQLVDAILGLGAITDADRRLTAAAHRIDAAIEEVRGQRATLADTLDGIDDDRARRAVALLHAPGAADLAALTAILDEPSEPSTDEAVLLSRRLAAMRLPDADEVTRLATQLREAAAEARRHDAGRSRASLRSAELLRLAIEHHDDRGSGPCPVCGTGDLDGDWRSHAAASLAELRDRTLAAQTAAARLAALLKRAHYLIEDLTAPDGHTAGVPVDELRAAAAALRLAPGGPDELAEHLTTRYPAVLAAARAARAYATDLLRRRDASWPAAADQVRAWIAAAGTLPERERAVARLQSARAWLTTTGAQLRDQRLAPMAAHAQRVWTQLRQERTVQVGAMTLAGTDHGRRVVVPVNADGGTALGVLSRGELHALGLATFLPRGCAPESPFRFVVVDDPVQSMDPTKVDGLARVLAELAEQRQVLVFTHDARLPDALAGLEPGRCRIVEVTRAERSVVTLRPAADPVTRYLDEAYALARAEEMPAEVRGPVVAELCRSAIEAACHRTVWRRRVARGVPHEEITAAVVAASGRLPATVALALFDDPDRGREVLGYLSRRHGPRAATAYKVCSAGVHGAYLFDLPGLVADARHLATALRPPDAAIPAPRSGAEVRS